MIKTIIPALLIIAALSSCSSLKPVTANTIQRTPVEVSRSTNKAKFLDNISVTSGTSTESGSAPTQKDFSTKTSSPGPKPAHAVSIEKISALQLKYGQLMNIDAELLTNDPLLVYIDEWYGTRYRMGGTTKQGIDCSAFVQTIYLSAFGLALPRTAREQYKTSRIISATELKEGDLVFFNTRGGVSHVGIYLQNNKFVHASTSNGVTISDMYDPYYLRHFIGAGRLEKSEAKNLDNSGSSSN